VIQKRKQVFTASAVEGIDRKRVVLPDAKNLLVDLGNKDAYSK
jgi:hypothetical protein